MSQQYKLDRAIDMADNVGSKRGRFELSAIGRLRIAHWCGAKSWEDINEKDQIEIVETYKISRRKYILQLYQNVIADLLELSKSFDGEFNSVENMCLNFSIEMVDSWEHKLKFHPSAIGNGCIPNGYEWKSKENR